MKYIRGLSLKKNRIESQCFVVEGEKSVSELLDSSFEIVELFALKDWSDRNKYLFHNIKVVSLQQLQAISNLKSPNMVLAVVKLPQELDIQQNSNVTLLLDRINDPGNLGTIVRTCDWFGVRRIVCSKDTVDVYNPKVIQASMGSVFRVQTLYVDLLDYLQEVKTPVYGADTNGQNIKNIQISSKIHLLMGNESHGLSKELYRYITKKVAINGAGNVVDSLNVAAATSIFLHEFCG